MVMSDISELRNLGPRSAEWLRSVGIETIEVLLEIGVAEAYLRAKDAYPDQVSLNLLYGLQAGIMDIDWRMLPEKMKRELREEIGE